MWEIQLVVNLCNVQDAFVRRYNLVSSRYPCVVLTDDWEHPFAPMPVYMPLATACWG